MRAVPHADSSSSISGHVAAVAAHAAGVGIHGHSASRQIAGVAVPHQDVPRLYACLLQSLGHRQRQRGVGGNAAAAQPIHLEPDRFARENRRRNHALPRLKRLLASGVGGHGLVQQVQHALLVRLSCRAVQRRIARNYHLRPACGLRGMSVEDSSQRQLVRRRHRTQHGSAGGCILQELPATLHIVSPHFFPQPDSRPRR